MRYPLRDPSHLIIPLKVHFNMKYESNMFTNILKRHSNVSYLILWSIFFFNINLLFPKTTPKENDQVLQVVYYKGQQQRHLFSCFFLVFSPPPLSILQAICSSWLVKLISQQSYDALDAEKLLSFNIAQHKFMHCS